MFKNKKKSISLVICIILTISLLFGCSNSQQKANTSNATNGSSQDELWQKAKTDMTAPYPETVNYTVGKQTINYSELSGTEYENDSDADNKRTRILNDKFNIQHVIKFAGNDGEDFKQKVSMALVSGDIPDIMVVPDYATVKELAENDLIADLTEVYENCASDKIKEIYDSYDGTCLDMAKVDGKLMALPETAISTGPEFVWVRKDWLDKLGLQQPTNIDELEHVLNEFVAKDPGGNGAGQTIGLAASYEYGTYGSIFQMNNMFVAYDAFPKQWIEKDGRAIYGSVQPEMKEALKTMADWYEKGLIDPQMPVRTADDRVSLISSGKAGAFHALWWGAAPNNPAAHCKSNNPDSEWIGCLIDGNDKGGITIFTGNPAPKYVVVRKDFEYPEIVFKVMNYTFDHCRFADKLTEQDLDYEDAYNGKVYDGALIPFPINIDFRDAGERVYAQLQDYLNGGKPKLQTWVIPVAEAVKGYEEKIANGETPEQAEWEHYRTRIEAYKTMVETGYEFESPVFFGVTKSMKLKWETLNKMEIETILQIITGQKPIEAFDDFVEKWYKLGGEQITKEVNDFVYGK